MVLGWSWIRKNTRSRIFFIRKNGTISFETFIETEDSYCIPRFPLTASCHKIADTQTSFTLCQGVGNSTLTPQPCFWEFHQLSTSTDDKHGSQQIVHMLSISSRDLVPRSRAIVLRRSGVGVDSKEQSKHRWPVFVVWWLRHSFHWYLTNCAAYQSIWA